MAGCRKNANPDTPPAPYGPENGRVGYPAQFKVTATDPDFDAVSVRVDWDDGWVHTRPSRTEQLVRVISEARTRAVAEQRADEVARIVEQEV